MPESLVAAKPVIDQIREYWDSHIHDLEIVCHEVGTIGFFDDLDEYRFDKLRYLPQVVDFKGYAGKDLLEVGCGAGIDLVRFAGGGAKVTGIDLAQKSIDLARSNFQLRDLTGELKVMNGESLEYPDNHFDVVYAHGVLQYTSDTQKMIDEIYRVLRPGGEAVMMVYNRWSWLNLLSKVMNVGLEHADAPVLKKFSVRQIKKMLFRFHEKRVFCERFPVKTRLHSGLKAMLYNGVFVPLFGLIPRPLIRWSGWHIMVFAKK